MSGGIFINYRRGDQPGFAGRLHDRLEQVFPAEQLFMDVDSIPYGADFVDVLDKEIQKCDVLLAVIGDGWLSATDSSGRRRLELESDFVRVEIEAALKQGKWVIPVLIGNAAMAQETDLPGPLKALARRNAIRVTHERFRSDCDSLVHALKKILDEAQTRRQANDERLAQKERAKRQDEAAERADKERQVAQIRRLVSTTLPHRTVVNDEHTLGEAARRWSSPKRMIISICGAATVALLLISQLDFRSADTDVDAPVASAPPTVAAPSAPPVEPTAQPDPTPKPVPRQWAQYASTPGGYSIWFPGRPSESMEGTTHRAILEFNNEVFYSYYTDFDGQSVESLTGVMRSSFSKINIDVRDEKKVTVDELPAVRFVLYSRERQGIEHMLLIFRQKSSNIRMYGVFYGAFPEKDDAGERFMNSFRQLK